MATRHELITALQGRYCRSGRSEKARILDEFVALTGYHRKHAIRVLTGPPPTRIERVGRSIYDEAVRQALVTIWETSDRICGKRLKPAMQNLVDSMERHGHLALDTGVRERLLNMSPATIDRLLAPNRASTSTPRKRIGATLVGRHVPIRTSSDWSDAAPGFFEVDFVAHGGGSMSGSFVHSLVLTEIVSGWTECVPLINREQSLVVEAFKVLNERLPTGIRGLDTDNDSAFINETVLEYCQAHDVVFTRSRARRKNDQAWIEQKNGAVVRRLVGYARYEGLEHARRLSRLYEAARLFVNFFQPSFKLKEKTRTGARVSKRYYAPATPCERLLEHAEVPEDVKTRLRETRASLDPVMLLREIRAMQRDLVAGIPGDLSVEQQTDQFLANLSALWRRGEEPRHRKLPTIRTWRTRTDPFAQRWSTILAWLDAEPDLSAKAAFQRLREQHPEEHRSPGQVRSLQRRFSAWRQERAKELIMRSSEKRPDAA